MWTPELFKAYEEGKNRRYQLFFAVNGGAFDLAKRLAVPQEQTGRVLVATHYGFYWRRATTLALHLNRPPRAAILISGAFPGFKVLPPIFCTRAGFSGGKSDFSRARSIFRSSISCRRPLKSNRSPQNRFYGLKLFPKLLKTVSSSLKSISAP